MEPFSQWPQALQRRWLVNLAICALFPLAGLAAWLTLDDLFLFALSLLLSLAVLVRSLLFYRAAASRAYETVEGVCIGLRRQPLREQQTVRLLTAHGLEHTLTLDKRTRLLIGNQYRFYFQKAGFARAEPLPEPLRPRDQFLGMEDLGPYRADVAPDSGGRQENPEDTGQGGERPL